MKTTNKVFEAAVKDSKCIHALTGLAPDHKVCINAYVCEAVSTIKFYVMPQEPLLVLISLKKNVFG